MNTFPPPTPPIAPAAAARPKPPAKTIGIFAAVAVVAAGGTFLVTRGDDPQTVAPATSTTVAVTVSPSTTTPLIVQPSTTVPAATPQSTVPSTVVTPAGATEVGYGVYVPAISDVTVTGDGPFTLTNATTGSEMILQVLNRVAGEDPNVVIQEYIDQFDADYELIGYGISTTFEPGANGHPNLRSSYLDYTIYVEDPDGKRLNTNARINAIVREDGLTLLTDTYGPGGQYAVSSEDFATMVDSLAAAPSVGDAAAWFPVQSKVPSSVHRQVDLPFPSNARLTLADGYEVVASTSSSIEVTNGNEIIVVMRLTGIADFDAATAGAVTLLSGTRVTTSLEAFGDAVEYDSISNRTARWEGNDVDGLPIAGQVMVTLDTTTHNANVIFLASRESRWNYNELMALTFGIRLGQPTIV